MQERVPSVGVCVCSGWRNGSFSSFHSGSTPTPSVDKPARRTAATADERRLSLLYLCVVEKKKMQSFNQVKAGI